jgi:putative peptidoglycan lipid II flippase
LLNRLKISKNVLIVMFMTVMVHGLTFGREVAIAWQFGISGYADGIAVGLIPITLYMSIWGHAYVNAALTRIEHIDNQSLITASLQPLLRFGLLSMVLLFAFAEPFAGAIAPGLTSQGRELAIALMQTTAAGAFLVSMTAWAKGLLHLQGRFAQASFADMMPNAGYLLGIVWLFQYYGVYGVAIGGLAGYLLQWIIVMPFKAPYCKISKISAINQADRPGLKIIFTNMLLATLSYSVVYIDVLVDRYFASSLGEGQVAVLGFAEKLMMFPLYTIIFAVTTVLFPQLIQLRFDLPAFKRRVSQVYRLILLLAVAITVVSVLFDEWLVATVFNYGAFDEAAVVKTAEVFVFYMLGFGAHAYVFLASRVRYALEDFKLPVFAGLLAAVVNVLLDIMLVDEMGIKGLALATTVAALVNALLLVFMPLRSPQKTPVQAQ